MEKKINVVVTIDKTEMTKKKLERLARYYILLKQSEQENKSGEVNNA